MVTDTATLVYTRCATVTIAVVAVVEHRHSLCSCIQIAQADMTTAATPQHQCPHCLSSAVAVTGVVVQGRSQASLRVTTPEMTWKVVAAAAGRTNPAFSGGSPGRILSRPRGNSAFQSATTASCWAFRSRWCWCYLLGVAVPGRCLAG